MPRNIRKRPLIVKLSEDQGNKEDCESQEMMEITDATTTNPTNDELPSSARTNKDTTVEEKKKKDKKKKKKRKAEQKEMRNEEECNYREERPNYSRPYRKFREKNALWQEKEGIKRGEPGNN